MPPPTPISAAPPPIAPRDPRVLYAAGRTLLAWIRTGLALMGFGFVVARFGLFPARTCRRGRFSRNRVSQQTAFFPVYRRGDNRARRCREYCCDVASRSIYPR